MIRRHAKRLYLGFAAAVLGGYALAESSGWAGGGSRQAPIPEELRASPQGHRNFVFWYHGLRGK